MKLKGFALTLLLAVAAMVASVPALADPMPAPPSQLTCIKAQSDVALHLRVTNNATRTLSKGRKISYAYKTSANGVEIKGVYTLESNLAGGQSRSFFVFPQAAHDTPLYQCTASVTPFAQAVQPKNP